MMASSRTAVFTFSSLLSAFSIAFLISGTTWAHDGEGYSHGSSTAYSDPDWMGALPDTLRISELSIPGTHDTMAKCGTDMVECQSLKLEHQLVAGIRALDIRARRIWNHFDITHGCNQQGDNCWNLLVEHYEFDDALCRTVKFLDDHPTETVLMRVQDAGCPIDPHREFWETYLDYVENQREPCVSNGTQIAFKDYIWKGDYSSVPTLGDVRGKIVILDNFSGGKYGLDYQSDDLFQVQDWYSFSTNWDLDDKWYRIEDHLQAADAGSLDTIYVNFLSGSGGSFPYFVASGHSSPGTSAPRLGMGWCSITKSCYPFHENWAGCCYFDGTNELTHYYISAGNVARRIGIIMADFPRDGLIDDIIGLNPWNLPPVASCQDVLTLAGPECMAVADIDKGSHDPDGDPIVLTQDPPEPYALGDTPVTLTVYDDNGDFDTCEAVVTVLDETSPIIECNAPSTIIPPDAPVSFAASAMDNCGSASVSIQQYDCFKFTKKGKWVNKAESCEAAISDDAISILDSGGKGNNIEWEVAATDPSGNEATVDCGVSVVTPARSSGHP